MTSARLAKNAIRGQSDFDGVRQDAGPDRVDTIAQDRLLSTVNFGGSVVPVGSGRLPVVVVEVDAPIEGAA